MENNYMAADELRERGVEIRSDHLLAVLEYAQINLADGYDILSAGANEQGLDGDEQLEYVNDCIKFIKRLIDGKHQPLYLVTENVHRTLIED